MVIRSSFFELVSHYLSICYTFAIGQNNSEGRIAFEMTGILGTDYYTDDCLVELLCGRYAEELSKIIVCTPMWYIPVPIPAGSTGRCRLRSESYHFIPLCSLLPGSDN